MGLRVFDNGEGKLFLEITAPELQLQTVLFVPALPQTNPAAKNAQDSLEFISVSFRTEKYFVPYLFVTAHRRGEDAWQQVGELEQTDSINILNHIVDVLAYPSPTRG